MKFSGSLFPQHCKECISQLCQSSLKSKSGKILCIFFHPHEAMKLLFLERECSNLNVNDTLKSLSSRIEWERFVNHWYTLPSCTAAPSGRLFKSEYAHNEPVWLNLMPYSSLIWESEVEEGAVAVCRAAFLAAETLSTSTFWPQPASVRRRQSDRLKGERTLPPWDSQRPHFPSNSFRSLFSLQLELWVLLRFFWCGFDSKDKCFSPLQPPLSSLLLFC